MPSSPPTAARPSRGSIPFALFEKPESGVGFCCDQLAIYVPKHDLMVWLMQGEADMEEKKGNTIRIMVAHGDDIAKRNFHFYDFTPNVVGHPTGEWFDFPDLAFSDGHLFMAFNRFDFGEHGAMAGLDRLPPAARQAGNL